MKKLEFGEILRKARKSKGYTQEEMAGRMHMSRENISKLELNRVELKAADFIRWFQVTNMPEISAAMLCGIDPSVLIDLINHLPVISQLIGGFVFWLFT